jgi:hypothetical protein
MLVNLCFPPYRFLSLDSLLPAGAGATPDAPGWGPPSYFARRRLLSIERTEMGFPEISIERLELAPECPQRDRSPAPGCELIMHLRSAARITAYIGAPADAGAGGQPSCSFRSGAGAAAIDAFVLDRSWRDGTVILRTASGPDARRSE